jgi:hypothetical protein
MDTNGFPEKGTGFNAKTQSRKSETRKIRDFTAKLTTEHREHRAFH